MTATRSANQQIRVTCQSKVYVPKYKHGNFVGWTFLCHYVESLHGNLPKIEMDRHFFGFKNCWYHTGTDTHFPLSPEIRFVMPGNTLPMDMGPLPQTQEEWQQIATPAFEALL